MGNIRLLSTFAILGCLSYLHCTTNRVNSPTIPVSHSAFLVISDSTTQFDTTMAGYFNPMIIDGRLPTVRPFADSLLIYSPLYTIPDSTLILISQTKDYLGNKDGRMGGQWSIGRLPDYSTPYSYQFIGEGFLDTLWYTSLDTNTGTVTLLFKNESIVLAKGDTYQFKDSLYDTISLIDKGDTIAWSISKVVLTNRFINKGMYTHEQIRYYQSR